jgi:hypothetical protein
MLFMKHRIIPGRYAFLTQGLIFSRYILKGLSHEIDFDNIDKNLRMLALISAAAGF